MCELKKLVLVLCVFITWAHIFIWAICSPFGPSLTPTLFLVLSFSFFITLNRYFYFFSRWRRMTQNVVMDSIWWVKKQVREWVELFFSFVCILVSSLFHPFFCSSSLDFLLLFMVAKAMLLQIIPSRVNYS